MSEIQATESASFSAMIDGSRAQNEATPLVAPVAQKKRGRKPGSIPWNKGKQLSREGIAGEPVTGAGLPDSPPVDIPVPTGALKGILQAPFNVVADQMDFDGFRLPDESAEEMAPLLDAVLKRYMPQISGESSPLVALALALGAHSGTAYLAYLAKKKQDRKQSQEREQKATVEMPNPSNPFHVTHVG